MEAQVNELSLYRINAVIGDTIRLLYSTGWSEKDALYRVSTRLQAEAIPLYTLSILDRRPIL